VPAAQSLPSPGSSAWMTPSLSDLPHPLKRFSEFGRLYREAEERLWQAIRPSGVANADNNGGEPLCSPVVATGGNQARLFTSWSAHSPPVTAVAAKLKARGHAGAYLQYTQELNKARLAIAAHASGVQTREAGTENPWLKFIRPAGWQDKLKSGALRWYEIGNAAFAIGGIALTVVVGKLLI
jgi:hypothetical protein